jgi:hypothetical protein
MKLSKTKIRKVKTQLRRLHKVVKSYRVMARDYFKNEIKFGTLQRFAEDEDYVPQDEKILKALGLITPPNPYRVLPIYFQRIPAALAFWNEKRTQIKTIADEAKRQRLNTRKPA